MDVANITDVYLNKDNPSHSFYFPGPVRVSSGDEPFIEKLLSSISSENKTDFVTEVDGVRFRSTLIPSVGGPFYIYRKLPDKVWTIDQCGIHPAIKKMILDERLNSGGLVVISGMPGNGKSTTCGAIVSERLLTHGGVCNTIEDPAEMPLQGFHGSGFCLQREVTRGESAYSAMVDTLRAYPAKQNTMMLVGEVRDSSTASLALQSAVDGRLVIFTTHAGDVIETVRRVISLACGEDGVKYEQARELFAAGFRLVAHQKLVDGKLRLGSMADTQSAAAIIRGDGDLTQLKNTIIEQSTKIKKGIPIELRKT